MRDLHETTAAARELGSQLRGLGYAEDAVVRLLGDDAYSSEGEPPVVAERRLPQTPLATAIRLFFLQRAVPRADAARALRRDGLEALAATGLATVGDDVVPRVRILPVGTLLVASDDFPGDTDDGDKREDYVAAYTPTSQILDSLTPRRRIARALDVGTGSGVHALLAARHAEHVVATDVNSHALEYTQLNAALNGFTNIECRRGSLFEPADGERFDLITCNAPYVVSPENRWIYRDAGLEGDEVSRHVVRGAAKHLSPDGYATLMVSWLADDEDDLDAHPLAWVNGVSCDSWILPIWGADPLGHAATWNDHLEGEERKLGDALDAWTGYLERMGVRWVSEGALLLHKHAGERNSARVDSLEEDDLEPASEQIQRAFASRARLEGLARDTDLLAARLRLAAPLRLEHVLEPNGGNPTIDSTSIELAAGTHSVVETSEAAAELVTSLDAHMPLEDVVRSTAERLQLSKADASRLRRDAVRLCRELLELGALAFDGE